jgi:hypothetical protein
MLVLCIEQVRKQNSWLSQRYILPSEGLQLLAFLAFVIFAKHASVSSPSYLQTRKRSCTYMGLARAWLQPNAPRRETFNAAAWASHA